MKIFTSYISKENLDLLISLNYLPMFIIRNMRDSKLRNLSPSTELLHQFKNNIINRDEYKDRYLLEIVSRNISFSDLIMKFSVLDKMVSASGIVLLGYNQDPELCHRRFLAEFMEKITGYKIDEWKKNY